MTDLAAHGSPRHRREPGEPAAARQAHQECLGLIVARMRREDADRARLARGLGEQRVARFARARRAIRATALRRTSAASRAATPSDAANFFTARASAADSLRKP